MKRCWLYIFSILFFFFSLSSPVFAEIVAKDVSYKHGDAKLEGYLAYNDSISGKRPSVIIVHEWKGLGDYAKSRAKQLAGMGYVAFAIDMYGKGIRPQSHEEAGKLAGIYKSDRNLMRERAKAGLDYLKSFELTDAEKIAAIGYCFGGTTALEMARAGFDLKGVASFHGDLSTPVPAKPGDIKAKIIVFQGGDDSFTLGGVDAFKKEMTVARPDFQFHVMEGAVHSFTVPAAGSDKASGVAYNAEADKRSWTLLTQFLNEIFQTKYTE